MVCMALLTKTPFIALPSNTQKIQGLLDDVGLPYRLSSDVVSLGKTSELACWRKGELEKIDAYLSHARQSIAAMFAALRAKLN